MYPKIYDPTASIWKGNLSNLLFHPKISHFSNSTGNSFYIRRILYSNSQLTGWFFHILKGQFQVTLHALMAMSDLQLYPWNITLINNGENIMVFLTEKVFISVSFSIASFSQKNALSQKKLQKKINSIKKKNIDT